MERLHRETPCRLTERVLQFGEGNFLRGFVDWMFDRLNKENGGDFGVVVVQPINAGPVVNFLNEQDGLYDLYLRGLIDGERVEETRVVECITRGINPYTDTDAFFECALNPDLRYIVSNTTEAGIEYKPGQSADDFENNTFPGRLTMFLKKRFDAGLPGFLLLPCELIDKNGAVLKECVLKYADDFGYGEEFKKWVEEENYFTSTLVDRIVTGYPRDTA
ncbi:MAG: tagaturonate reductase, partial [Candidatus Ornithomonoglobus sp.]